MKRWRIGVGLAVLISIGIAACAATTPEATPIPPGDGAGLANPASVYCVELGYQLLYSRDTYLNDCVFPDGSKCEEWAFFRGECGQPFSYCVKNGGKLEQRENLSTCVFTDGSICPESDFFTEKCKQGDNPAP